jgi:hypothetical protein
MAPGLQQVQDRPGEEQLVLRQTWRFEIHNLQDVVERRVLGAEPLDLFGGRSEHGPETVRVELEVPLKVGCQFPQVRSEADFCKWQNVVPQEIVERPRGRCRLERLGLAKAVERLRAGAVSHVGDPLRGRIPDLVENLRPQLRRGRRQRSDG